MKFKLLLAAAALSITSLSASATTTAPVLVSGTFSNLSLGTITLASLSKVTGQIVSGTGSYSIFGNTFTLTAATITSGKIGTRVFTGNTFSFASLGAGVYNIKVSGSAGTFGSAIGLNYHVSPVPEPKVDAMLFAGLGIIGFLAYRRKSYIY